MAALLLIAIHALFLKCSILMVSVDFRKIKKIGRNMKLCIRWLANELLRFSSAYDLIFKKKNIFLLTIFNLDKTNQ